MDTKKYRLVTKADFDGMVCNMLLKELDIIDRVVFAHPRDIESGKLEITGEDITAGLPYKENVHIAFDYYPGSLLSAGSRKNLAVDHRMPSTSRVIYNYYGKDKFSNIPEDILDAVDKGFSARITIDEILYPTGWILLNYIIDQRTGLEGFKKFSISHPELIINLANESRTRTIWEILNLPYVEERLNLYFSCIEEHKAQILRCTSVYSNLVVIDIRKEKVIYPGNRFMVYALFPECNVSMHVTSAANNSRTIFVVGKSVLDRTYSPDIGMIMKKYGGGGHSNAGTCQTTNDTADEIAKKLIGGLKYGLVKNLFMGYFNYY